MPEGETGAFAEAAARIVVGGDPEVEARGLLASMTIEEKLGCLDGDTPFWEGLIDTIRGGYYRHPWPAAEVSRLGVPGIRFSDGPRGVVVGHATAFPVSMARGATFDPELEERIGAAIGRELRASGATFFGGVCVNLLRHPAWGRAQETYGEDPCLVGRMGAALARGVQRHALACVKHFACNSMENARFRVDVTADERALHEVYLPHFREVVDAGVAAVMTAYNSLNGEWCGQHRGLLADILREEWGFAGVVISDFQFGFRDAVRSVEAGLDIEMPFRQQRAQHLPGALASGELPFEVVDACVLRILTTLLRFANVLAEPPPPIEVIACAEHRALAREACAQSIVLLRNERSILPLDRGTVRSLAVIGRLAAVPNLGDGGSSDVHPPSVTTPLEGLRQALPDAEVQFVDGSDLAAAQACACDADVAVVVVGTTRVEEGEYIDPAAFADLGHLFPPLENPELGEELTAALADAGTGTGFSPGGDRTRLELSEDQEVLIESVASVQPRTIVVLMGGSAIAVQRWYERAAAILMLWYPGMEGGHALADVLLGRRDPGGRLPFAVPRDAADLCAFDRDAAAATYDLWHGQWKLDRDGVTAAYPFGFGLSYAPSVLRDARLEGDAVIATVDNPSARRGSVVLQAYGSVPGSRYERPLQRLVGFSRAEVEPGDSATVRVPLALGALRVREAGAWVDENATIEIRVGCYAGDPGAIVLRRETTA